MSFEKEMEEKIIEKLKTVKDPEMNIDIVNLGLIYDIKINKNKGLVSMTLTSPTCPYTGMILAEIEETLSTIDELDEIHVDLIWDPPWEPKFMSDEAKAMLGYYGED